MTVPPWNMAYFDIYESQMLQTEQLSKNLPSIECLYQTAEIVSYMIPRLCEISSFKNYTIKLTAARAVDHHFGFLTEEHYISHHDSLMEAFSRMRLFGDECSQIAKMAIDYEDSLRKRGNDSLKVGSTENWTLSAILSKFWPEWKEKMDESKKSGTELTGNAKFQHICYYKIDSVEHDRCRIAMIGVFSNFATQFFNFSVRVKQQLNLMETFLKFNMISENFISDFMKSATYKVAELDARIQNDLMKFQIDDLVPFYMSLIISPSLVGSLCKTTDPQGQPLDAIPFEKQIFAKLENLLPFVKLNLQINSPSTDSQSFSKMPQNLMNLFANFEKYYLEDDISNNLLSLEFNEFLKELMEQENEEAKPFFTMQPSFQFNVKKGPRNMDENAPGEVQLDSELSMGILRKFNMLLPPNSSFEANIVGIVFDSIEEEELALSMEDYIRIIAKTTLFNGLVISNLGPSIGIYVNSRISFFKTINIICQHSRLSSHFIGVVGLLQNSLQIDTRCNQPGYGSDKDFTPHLNEHPWKSSIFSRTISVSLGWHILNPNAISKEKIAYTEDAATPILIVAAVVRNLYQRFRLPLDHITKCILNEATPVRIDRVCIENLDRIKLCLDRPRILVGKTAKSLRKDELEVAAYWKGRAKYGMGILNYANAVRCCRRELEQSNKAGK